jgi:hypothetical protein
MYQFALGVLAFALSSATLGVTADQDLTSTIQAVIQHSNDEQAQAIAGKDFSVMADTVTSDHFQELVKINQDLIDHDAVSVTLVHVDWGDVTVNGPTASATDTETWDVMFSTGKLAETTDRNLYTLVLDNGTWKIQSDTYPDRPPANASASEAI